MLMNLREQLASVAHKIFQQLAFFSDSSIIRP